MTNPVGRPRKHRVKFGTTIRQEDADLLTEKEHEGLKKNEVIDQAFDALREKGGECSRGTALRIARETLEKAEQGRADAAEYEANRGILYREKEGGR